MNIAKTLVAASALALVLPGAAHASVTVDIQQAGADVVATTSGSLDLTGYFYNDGVGVTAGIGPGIASFISNSGSFATYFAAISGPSSFGPGGPTPATSASGAIFGFSAALQLVGVPGDYVPNAPLSATTTFANQSIATMGLTPGSYVYTLQPSLGGGSSACILGQGSFSCLPADTITVNVLQAAVPEPASWALMIAGFGLLGGALRRTKLGRSRYAMA